MAMNQSLKSHRLVHIILIIVIYHCDAITSGETSGVLVQEGSTSPRYSRRGYSVSNGSDFSKITTGYYTHADDSITLADIHKLEYFDRRSPMNITSQYSQVSLVNEDFLRELPYLSLVPNHHTREEGPSLGRLSMKAAFSRYLKAVQQRYRQAHGCSYELYVRKWFSTRHCLVDSLLGHTKRMNLTMTDASEGFKISSIEFTSFWPYANVSSDPKPNIDFMRNLESKNRYRVRRELLEYPTNEHLDRACMVFLDEDIRTIKRVMQEALSTTLEFVRTDISPVTRVAEVHRLTRTYHLANRDDRIRGSESRIIPFGYQR